MKTNLDSNLTIRINADLKNKFKIIAIGKNTNISEVLTGFIKLYVNNNSNEVIGKIFVEK